MIKKLYVVLIHLVFGRHGRIKLVWISKNGLHISKLVQHAFRKITDHARSVFEPTCVDVDMLERACLGLAMNQANSNKVSDWTRQLFR